jgi:hypothetical protein
VIAVSLDILPTDQAAALLVCLAGRAGLSSDDPAVAEITRLCGYLPLAIGMVARQLHHHPAWTLSGRAAELAAARDRLELMATENLSVDAAFNLSYADLTPGQQRLFRRLGLHPGADIDGYAAAALTTSTPPPAPTPSPPAWPGPPRPPRTTLYRPQFPTSPTGGRHWRGAALSARPCSPASITPQVPASTPGLSP